MPQGRQPEMEKRVKTLISIYTCALWYTCVYRIQSVEKAEHTEALLPENMSREIMLEPFRSPIAEIKNNSLHPLVEKMRECLGFSLNLNDRRRKSFLPLLLSQKGRRPGTKNESNCMLPQTP